MSVINLDLQVEQPMELEIVTEPELFVNPSSAITKGDKGDPGNSASSFIFVQTPPSALWIINHNFGYKPNVEVLDSSGKQVIADVQHTSNNQVTVSFLIPVAGEARCI